MSALPRPDLPPGPQRDLVAELHGLHLHAGWPSLRALAKDTGVSHTTVSKALSSPVLPTWGTLELLVEAMSGDTAHFHDLWIAASTPANANANGNAPATPQIAGRRTELAVVRRHLETGSGLLLVTGEAGIGKTTLVSTAASTSGVFVATGRCLPLSTEAPLLPFIDLLASTHGAGDGSWFTEAIADTPRFVRSSLARLLPQLEEAGAPVRQDDFAQQHLFTAVGLLLSRLADLQPIGIVLEDLHWADTTTLDLLEHLAQRGGPPMVGTWRTDDHTISATHAEWLVRARRLAVAPDVPLAPLSLAETGEQVRALGSIGADEGLVRRIHQRSRGHPLFTHHLALQPHDSADLPSLLTDVLDRRLRNLDDDASLVVSVLATAERTVDLELVEHVTALGASRTSAALRDLSARRLLSDEGTAGLQLAHPLLGDAARRRQVAGEGPRLHRRIAEVLVLRVVADPDEVAEHWRAASDDQQEIGWRIAAAQRAQDRFAAREATDHWNRVLDLWQRVDTADLEVSQPQVFCLAYDAARATDVEAAMGFEEAALGLTAPVAERAALLSRFGHGHCISGRSATGLAMLGQAVELFVGLPASHEHVRCLVARMSILILLGRYDEARLDVERATQLLPLFAASTRDRLSILSWSSWLAMSDGDLAGARRSSQEALALAAAAADPFDAVPAAVQATEILLQCGAPLVDVSEAAAPAFALIADVGLGNALSYILRCNVAAAHLRVGDVAGALETIESAARSAPEVRTYSVHTVRALIEAVQGQREASLERVAALDLVATPVDSNWAENQVDLAAAELWCRQPARTAARLQRTMAFLLPTDNAGAAAAALATHARAIATVAQGRSPAQRGRAARDLDELRAHAKVDPFGLTATGVTPRVWGMVFTAELARLRQVESIDSWLAAAREWDAFTRPHDAAYCRWRAAQVALRDDQGTVAARLLKRAANDAREHVPLSEAIAGTARTGR